MTARPVLALLGALSTLGCADMLGLGGLTFDQEATGGAGPTSTGGSGGSETGGSSSGGLSSGSGGEPLVVGSGGAAEPTPSLSDDYPATLITGGTLVATWAGLGPDVLSDNSTFWIYEPESGALSTHLLDLLLDDDLGSAEVPSGREHLYAPRFGDTTWLFVYDEATGLVDYGAPPAPGEPFDSAMRAGSPGWTHLILAGDPRDPFLVAADRTTGIVRLGPADPETEAPLVTSVVWEADFTELVPFRHGDAQGVLRLNSALGSADFVPIEEAEFGEPVSLGSALSPDWSLAASYPSAGSAALLLYWANDGRTEAYRSRGSDLYLSEDVLWQRDVTDMVTVVGDDAPWAVTYDSATGVTDLRQLEPLEPTVVVK